LSISSGKKIVNFISQCLILQHLQTTRKKSRSGILTGSLKFLFSTFNP